MGSVEAMVPQPPQITVIGNNRWVKQISRPRRMNRIYSRFGNSIFTLILWNQPRASINELLTWMVLLAQGLQYVLAASGKRGWMPSCQASPEPHGSLSKAGASDWSARPHLELAFNSSSSSSHRSMPTINAFEHFCDIKTVQLCALL